MSDEKKSLLKDDTEDSSSPGKSDEYLYEISAQNLKAWKSNYGAVKDTAELIPVDNRIKFTWCDINAFCKQPPDPSKNKIISYFSSEDRPQKQILKNVNGVAYPGELLVLMGSSGAGKTTLMNCMTFRNLKLLRISGLVCINDQPVTQTQLAAQSAYVQQDDLFIGSLTVKEHLIFQSLVRMDADLTYKQRMKRIEEVMCELSLKKCEDVQIGEPGISKGISGGERKRLALGAELLNNPSLLFCDEPTSGLDSFMSLNVMQLLKSMAQTGRTVICTLHQPSSELYQLIDKIGLMAEGRTAFLGTPDEAEKFFTKLQAPCPEDYNPADHYIQLISVVPGREESCKEAIGCICDAFETSSNGIAIKKATAATKKSAIEDPWSNRQGLLSPYKVSWWAQFTAVIWRCWISLIKNPRYTKVKFYQTLFVSLLISVLYWHQHYDQRGVQNINGAIFLFVIDITYLNLMAVISSFCSELPLFLREHKNGMYRTDVYFISKILVDLPVSMLLNAMSTTICYFAIGLNPEWERYFMCVLICMLVTWAVMGAGYIVSTISIHIMMAQAILAVVLLPLLLFGGMFLSIKSIPWYLGWLGDLSWYKFGNEALSVNQWSNIDYISCSGNSSCFKNGLEVLNSEGFTVDQLWTATAALGILGFAFRALSFFPLLHKAYYFE